MEISVYDVNGRLKTNTGAGGGDALTADPLSQFAATTSLQLKGVISDETGSGALVFATSPTLVTPALGTPSSGTLTNCTGLVMDAGFTVMVDGGGSAITTGVKHYIEMPYAMTVTGWTFVADQTGSIVIDVWKDTYANYPPTVADTIAGTEKPTISASDKGQDLTLTTWTTSISKGDIIGINVDSAATVTKAWLTIRGTRVT